ncbi:mechanosensitive ion channel family protein [Cyanobium sp. HWJ4-Hawea]|uniref:mechanosensitive ion channel family protein n=1 Tax=Cyanobium sp. HWJ4-Hawea TaxID=2823713 RepID=UPI0020CF0C08|nr:mechanosensitive ion channel family protein [Cyanobium sp. HWJ4-Hawea]MCP9807870.1 mechanosensitive ion channel family protein [Cyanobium sp. HWJ4-Hawea]
MAHPCWGCFVALASVIPGSLALPDLVLLVANALVPFLFKLLGAVALWVVGGWLIHLAVRVLRKGLRHSSLDLTVAGYLVAILSAVLRVILVVAILGFFGIPTASFAALLAGAGVAIGAAWSGMLGNFAAGVFLQLFRPFSVGDVICAAGVTGTVEEIAMFSTSILGPDHVRNIVPNGKLFGDTIQNFSAHPYRRVEIFAQLDHSADLDRAILLIREGLGQVANQMPGLEPEVAVFELNDRGPKLVVRPFTPNAHYVQVLFDTNRMLVEVLGRNGFPIPKLQLAMVAEAENAS